MLKLIGSVMIFGSCAALGLNASNFFAMYSNISLGK